MSEIKKVRLVRTGPAQTVEIPPEFAMPGSAVLMHREGDKLIIEPVRELGMFEWLATLTRRGRVSGRGRGIAAVT